MPVSAGRSAANVISRSGSPAIARMHPTTARLKGSVGPSVGFAFISFDPLTVLISAHDNIGRRLRQVFVECTLEKLGNEGALELITLIHEG